MASEESRRPGRPSTYTPQLATIICERIADGESLRRICRDEAMPGKSTVWQWLDAHPEFAAQYARAREMQAEGFFEEIIEIADDGRRDYQESEEGAFLVDHDHIQRAKLRVDARKWVAARMAPKKYGEPARNTANPEEGGGGDESGPGLQDPNPDV